MKKNILSVLSVLAFVFVSANAQSDDILSILDADSSSLVPSGNVDTALVQSLKKQIGNVNPEQNIFLDFLKNGQFEKALFQWGSAFKNSSFAKSPNGQALYGYLLYQNGLTVVGIETLFQANPNQLSKEVMGLWREVAPATHNVWSLAQLEWQEGWSKVFDLATEVRVRGRNFHSVKNLEPIIELTKKTTVNSPERAWLEWQLALGLALKGDIARAAKVLKHLMEAPNNRVTVDHMNLTAARLLFQNGYLDAAVDYYSKIPKNSDFWIEAQEEKGWAYIRKGETQNAMAMTQTLMAKVFEDQVGPEAVFLHALSQLKVCDYPGVVETLNSFRARFRPKAAHMVELAKTGVTEESQKLVERMKSGRVKLVELGKAALFVPRLASRDEVLLDLVQTQKALEAESKVADTLYSRSLSGGTAQVGFQASIHDIKTAVDARVQSARSASFNRIKVMAEAELSEFKQILQKMHIVEAEVIQQITQAEKVIQASATKNVEEKTGTTGSKAKDKLVFPFTGETWFDELANYRVSIKKGCQAKAQ